jgi:hypothetical protein
VNHPEKRWMNWMLAALFIVTITLSILGLLVGPAT